jgi:hypothetical protein
MSTEVSKVIGEIGQIRDEIAQIIRDRGSYIAPNTKLKELVPYIRSFAQPELEEGIVTPASVSFDAYPSKGYVGFSKVTVNPIPYQRKDTDVTVDGATVNIPYGYYRSNVSKSVASGSASTPATTITANPSLATTYTSGSGYKMTVSKTQSVTPTVSAGYVSSGTAGTITVSGSAYVPQSSTGSATASTTDTAKRNIGYGQQTTIGAGYYPTDRIVRNSVAAGSAKTPADTITATNTVTIDENGLITATASGSKSITPTVKAGYVNAGTAGTVSASGTGTLQLTKRTSSDLTVSGAKVTAPAGYYPNAADTTLPSAGMPQLTFTAVAYDDEGEIEVKATATQSAGYVAGGSNYRATYPKLTVSGDTATMECGDAKITRKVASVTRANTSITTTADDTNDTLTLSASNNQGTGYVTGSNQTASKVITLTASGATVTATDNSSTPVKISKSVTTATQATPGITVSSTGLITASATQTAGYVSAGTQSTTKQLTTQGGKTVTPTTSNQTAVASGRYTTGAVTVKGDSNLVAGNIKKGVSIFGVTGTYEGTGGASVTTCTITVTFTANTGNTLTSATTFANGAFSAFQSTTKSGTFTIQNVVCGSALSIGTTYPCTLYWSGSQQGHQSLYGGMITVPSTSGTYTVEVGVLDD